MKILSAPKAEREEFLTKRNNFVYKSCSHCCRMENEAILKKASLEGTEKLEKFSYCKACRQTCYCSRECQKADWPDHRLTCSRRMAGGNPLADEYVPGEDDAAENNETATSGNCRNVAAGDDDAANDIDNSASAGKAAASSKSSSSRSWSKSKSKKKSRKKK